MRKSKFTESQIVGILGEGVAGLPVAEICRKHGISIVDKYGAKRGLPIALCYSGTAFRKDSLEKTLGIEFKNQGSAEQLHET
jgi:hypothetical protein